MKFLFVLLFVSTLSGHALTAHAGVSAIRHANESYETARNRHLLKTRFNFPGLETPEVQGGRYITAERAKKPLSNVNLDEIPDVGSYPDLENQFNFVRDTRFIESSIPNFLRRPTWLYPDDGCYARAEIAKIQLKGQGFPAPKKVFVFGNLYASSNNSPSGYVQWWYHVAVAYRVGAEAYIMDPALEPKRPLKISEWNRLVGGERTKVQYSICSAETYDPTTDCNGSDPVTPEVSLKEQKSFLQDEWDRLVELNRQPENELGDLPPWLQN